MHANLLTQHLKAQAPWLMGILNVTPDSFSDAGKFLQPAAAIQQANTLLDSGAHIIDIGGESSGPGSQPVGAQQEQARVLPILRALQGRCCISIDTFKSETAALALAHGASIVNDISALRYDPQMAALIAKQHAFVVLMYSKESSSSPHVSQSEREYTDIIAEIKLFFEERIDYALSQGIARERLILDPGMGRFLSHRPDYSWELLRRLAELTVFGLPLMLGVSRKGFLGCKAEQQDYVSALAGHYALSRGASILRTHEVALTRSFIANP